MVMLLISSYVALWFGHKEPWAQSRTLASETGEMDNSWDEREGGKKDSHHIDAGDMSLFFWLLSPPFWILNGPQDETWPKSRGVCVVWPSALVSKWSLCRDESKQTHAVWGICVSVSIQLYAEGPSSPRSGPSVLAFKSSPTHLLQNMTCFPCVSYEPSVNFTDPR